MMDTFDRVVFQILAEQLNDEKLAGFESLGPRRRYTEKQKAYAFGLIEESGVRATAKILKMPRRTLQRWCRKYNVFVKRCPDWAYGWAERRRRRREFWEWHGY